MKKKIIRIIILLILIIGIAAFVLPKYVLPYGIIQPQKISENIHPRDLSLESNDITILAKDSAEIKGYWIKSDSIPSKSSIIFIHGVGGCKEHFLDLAKILSSIGIESILIDSRAHGKSGGKFCTYGYKEKEDISKLIDYLKEKNDTIPLGIWGNSMGGAIAIQALEHDKRIEFGIIESTFTDLNKIVYDYQKAHFMNIGLKSICNKALKEAGKIAQFNPDSVSPISSVKNISQPVLIAHGESDANIKFEYGKMLYDNLNSKEKVFVPVKDGGHFDLGIKGGKAYSIKLEEFILKHSN